MFIILCLLYHFFIDLNEGCGHGLLDVMFLLDGTSNTPSITFEAIRDWIISLIGHMAAHINNGAMWIGVSQFGFKTSRCNKTSYDMGHTVRSL